MGGPYALDFNAVIAFAALAGIGDGHAAGLLADVLPTVERIVIHALQKDSET